MNKKPPHQVILRDRIKAKCTEPVSLVSQPGQVEFLIVGTPAAANGFLYPLVPSNSAEKWQEYEAEILRRITCFGWVK